MTSRSKYAELPRRVCASTKTDYSKNRDSKKGEVKQETRVKADDELAVAVRPRGKYLYVASY